MGFVQAYSSAHAILQDKTLTLLTTYTLRLYKLVIKSKSRPEDNTVYLQVFLNETFAKVLCLNQFIMTMSFLLVCVFLYLQFWQAQIFWFQNFLLEKLSHHF